MKEKQKNIALEEEFDRIFDRELSGQCDTEVALKVAYHFVEWVLNNQWISVDDELPKLEEDVIVKTEFGECTGAWYSFYSGNWYDKYSGDLITSAITHWMKIPPMKNEGGEK